MKPANERALSELLFAVAALSVVALALTPIVTADFWQIEATGRWIVENRAFVYRDPFSFTAGDRLWIEHKWLFDAVVHLLFSGFGAAGPIALKAALMLAILVGLLRHVRTSGARALTAALVVLTVAAFPDRFTVRAHVAAYACLVWFHLLLVRRRAEPDRALWPLLVVQVLWANVHGSFILGPALVVLYGLGDVLNQRFGLPAEGGLRRWPRLALAMAAAAMLNPYGPLLYLSPLRHFVRGAESTVRLAEWQPPTWDGLTVGGQALAVALLVLAGLLAARLARRRGDAGGALVVAALAVLALGAYRFVLPSALGALPPLVVVEGRRRESSLATVLAIAAVVAIAAPRLAPPVLRLDPAGMPVAAADFLATRGVRGHVFNSFDYGAYLAARLQPAVRIYVDGRLDLYAPEVFADYGRALADPPAWQRIRDAGDIDLVVLAYNDLPPVAARFMGRLLDGGAWVTTFIGPRAAVLERRGAAPRDVYTVLRPRLDLGYLPDPGDPEVFEPAWRESARLLEVRPTFALAWLIRGALARRHPDPAIRGGACSVYEEGLRDLPGNGGLLFQLAGCLGNAGHLEAARDLYERLTLWPRFREGALVLLGVCHARLGALDRAAAIWREAVELYPRNARARAFLDELTARPGG